MLRKTTTSYSYLHLSLPCHQKSDMSLHGTTYETAYVYQKSYLSLDWPQNSFFFYVDRIFSYSRLTTHDSWDLPSIFPFYSLELSSRTSCGTQLKLSQFIEMCLLALLILTRCVTRPHYNTYTARRIWLSLDKFYLTLSTINIHPFSSLDLENEIVYLFKT